MLDIFSFFVQVRVKREALGWLLIEAFGCGSEGVEEGKTV